MPRIAFIAAMDFELQPLERRRQGQDWVCVAHGPGFKLARAAAEEALTKGPLTAMVSIGVCGALAGDLRPGEIVVDTEGCQLRCPMAFRSGRVVSQDRVAVSAEEKRRLALAGVVVEMESAAVRDVASSSGVPFYAVKAVSDTAGQTLPFDFNAYRDSDGRFSAGRIGLAAMLRPWLIPELMHMRKQANLAAEKLGEFLVHCEF